MKKLGLLLLIVISSSLFACDIGGNGEKVITVGASPTPHSAILNSEVVKSYIESKGYTLNVIRYEDYVTPNKALNDQGIDANYFQHTPYLLKEVSEKEYQLSVACEVHYEPLNLYSKTAVSSYDELTISIVNDFTNVERALALLKANSIISDYTMTDFNTSNPNDYITKVDGINVTLECLDPGLLTNKVNYDGVAIIPGNYALNAWGAEIASSYKQLGESEEVAGKLANILAVRTDDLRSEKTNILCEALSQEEVGTFINENYGPTVVYSYKDVRS